ncbi:MAG TPA: alanine racemase [Acidobacteriota bacterium]
MSSIDGLPTPALLLDLDILERNLERMAARAAALGVRLRPHLKTHKCVEVATLQRDRGAAGVTVSTLYEAAVFADHGFDDITWAFPVILSRLDEAIELAARIRLGLVIDSQAAVDALASRHGVGEPLRVWLKVDCGYHRAGVAPDSGELAALPQAIERADNLDFAGILSHSGHAYHAVGRPQMQAIAEQERAVMVDAAQRIRDAGVPVPEVSVGSTPAMSVVASLAGVTEARPGNYAFYDYTQCLLGSCEPGDCAVSVLTSVVSRMPRHSVVDAGALALSKDPGPEGSAAGMGPVYAEDGLTLDPDLHLGPLSQEHGIVSRPLPVGTRLRIQPNHSCLTVACFDEYQVVRGGEVVDRWKIWRGRDPSRGAG